MKLNGHQLIEALRFLGVHVELEPDTEELDTVVVFEEFQQTDIVDEDGRLGDAGCYISYDEYPEEGWYGPLGPEGLTAPGC